MPLRSKWYSMLESWNKTLDVLLIFAGLFSAVSTAFIIESYKTLQPDYSQYVATFLYSAAVAYNKSGSALPPLDIIQSPEASFRSTVIERWINGLWFISLAVSLLVALLSILVKQWLDEYRSRVLRSAPDHAYWARRHTLYYNGLRSWGVPVIISCLPFLLHVSLFLFLAGLFLFLRLLDNTIALALLILLVAIICLYLLSTALPAFYIVCPSTTPVVTHALRAWSTWLTLLGRVARLVTLPPLSSMLAGIAANIERWTHSFSEREGRMIFDAEDSLQATALAELIKRTSDRDVLAVVAEALGGFPAGPVDLFMHEHIEACDQVNRFLYYDESFTPPKNAGVFEATSFLRRQRARHALRDVNSPYFRAGLVYRVSDYFNVSLGMEAVLLSVLHDWEPGFSEHCGIRNLVAAVHALGWISKTSFDPSEPRLHAPLCLIFLRNAARIVELSKRVGINPLSYSPHFYSLSMIVFCASSLSSDCQEAATARYLTTIVDRGSVDPRDLTFPRSENPDAVRWEIPGPFERRMSCLSNALYTMLVHMDKYNIHPDAGNLVVRYVAELTTYLGIPWSDRKGLSDFILSESFEQYTTSVEEVASYAGQLSRATDRSCTPQRVSDYFLCASVLLSRASSVHLSPEQYSNDFWSIFSWIADCLCWCSLASNDVILLSHFLGETTELDRWMEISWKWPVPLPRPDHTTLERRTALAGALALSLQRRERMNLGVNPAWIHALFSNRAVVQLAESLLVMFSRQNFTTLDSEDQEWFSFARLFLVHWRQLSPSSWKSLCDRLCDTCSESGLSLEAIEDFRSGRFLGDSDGAAIIDCNDDCPCVRPYDPEPNLRQAEAEARTDGGWRARWDHRLKHWQPQWTKRKPRCEAGQGTSAEIVEV